MEEIDQRVAELEKDEVQRKAIATTWREKLLDWLHSLSACLTADEEYTSSCAGPSSQSNDPENHHVNYNDRNDSRVYSCALPQPTMKQCAPTRETTHQNVPAEGANIVSATTSTPPTLPLRVHA